MTMKETGEAILALGPSPEHREAVARSFFGTLLGQAVALVLMLVAYVAAVAMLFRFGGDELRALHASLGTVWFWALLFAPVGFIAVFQMLPTALRARRERRLFPLSRADHPPPPGYFRLYPYDASEAERFRRPDGAVERAAKWVQGTASSVLYLSGASGSGKSSLVSAGLVPVLEAEGWRAVQGRGLGKTYAELAARLEAISEPRDLAEQPKLDVYDRTVIVGRKLQERKFRGLLIVIDQFEEFLILEAAEERRAFADLLSRLSTEPIPGVKLLLVFREDYRALLFKQELPAYEPGRSAFELAPFTRREAEAFLQGGPSRLDDRGLAALLAGLDRIEGTPGLYRPITLNMAGLVLERTGAGLTGDPGRLIERYLADCLGAGKSRDFAAAVLEPLITREGTKEPRSEAELAAASGLQPWQIRATLNDLQQDGLVRLLDESRRIWEISHDFLARILARLLGRLRRPWLDRVARPVLAVALVGWLAVMLLAVPFHIQQRSDAAMRELLALGFTRLHSDGDGITLSGSSGPLVDEDLRRGVELMGLLSDAVRQLELGNTLVSDLSTLAGLPLWRLDLTDTGVSDLSALAGMPLVSLDLSGTGVTDLSRLAGLSLQWLSLTSTRVSDLSPLSGMPLQRLELSYTGVTDLSLPAGLPLVSLGLSHTGVTDLSPLVGLPLQELYLSGTGVTDLSALAGMPLLNLNLEGTSVRDLSPLSGMPLERLDLASTGVADLSQLAGLPLHQLVLAGTGVTDLSPLAGMPLLSLTLTNTGVTDLSPLAGMPLAWLDLAGTGVTDLSPLAGMSLESLGLSSTGVTDLSPLDGMDVRVIGP